MSWSLAGTSTVNVKKFKGITSFAQGGMSTIPIEDIAVDISRIIVITATVDNSTSPSLPSLVPTEFSASGGLQFSVWIDYTGIHLKLHPTNSAFILNREFYVLIVFA